MNSLIKPLFRLMVVTFIFAMLMPITTTLAVPNCDDPKFENKPACNPKDPNGEDPIVYSAELSLGGFVFNPGPSVDLLPDSKGTRLLSQTDLTMIRSDGADNGDNNISWDTVFAACQLLNGQINGFMVFNEKWSITNFDEIPRVAFADVLLDDGKVKLILRGDGISADPFLPVPGDPPSEFNLSEFSITGKSLRGVRPKTSCSPGSGQQINPLPAHSTLTITATGPS